jgi:hypothetical protein
MFQTFDFPGSVQLEPDPNQEDLRRNPGMGRIGWKRFSSLLKQEAWCLYENLEQSKSSEAEVKMGASRG